MPKQVYRLQGFHKGILEKWAGGVDNISRQDEMDSKAILRQAKNVMVDSIGQIRPAGFWELGGTWQEENHLVNYDIEYIGIPTNNYFYNSQNPNEITGNLRTPVGLNKYGESNSQFTDSIYQIKWSYVFKNDNEGLLQPLQSEDGTIIGEEISLNSNSFIDLQWWSNADVYNGRKIRFYIRDLNGSDDWYYLGTVGYDSDYSDYAFIHTPATDLVSGTRTSDSNPFWSIRIKGLPPITYETINGYQPDVDSLKMENPSDATFTNGRVFAIKDDKIYYSQSGRTGCFPRYNDGSGNILNPTESNAEGIAIESFGDMLVYFTKQDVSYISVAGMPSQWQVVKVFKNQGVENKKQVTNTDNGILWVNANGCFFSSGRMPQDLSQQLNKQEWAEDFYSVNADIGFIPNDNQVMVSNNNDYAICDLKTQSWVTGSFNTSVDAGKLTIGKDLLTKKGSDTYRWKNSPYINDSGTVIHQSGESQIVTNRIDFGNPNYIKKIYKVYITYANYETRNIGISLQFDSNASGTQTEFITKNTLPKSNANYNPVVKRLEFDIPNPEVAFCYLRIKWDGYVVIKDIAIEYRPLKFKRAVL